MCVSHFQCLTRAQLSDLVFGKGIGLYALWVSIGLIAYVYSLSRSTTIYCKSPCLWSSAGIDNRCPFCDFFFRSAHHRWHDRSVHFGEHLPQPLTSLMLSQV